MDVDTLNLSKVSLADDTLYIREWYSNHHTVTAYLAQADSTELANQVESLLVLGATVMTTAQPTLDLAHVKREFNDFQSRLEKSCQDFFGETGQLGNLLNGTHQTIAASLKQYLDESSANFVGFLVQKQVEALLIEQSQSWQTQLQGLFDVTQSGSPANSIVRAVQEQLNLLITNNQEVRDLLNQQFGRATESKRGTAKGRRYEDAAKEALRQLASVYLDNFEDTGNYTGVLGDSRKGDAVVTLNRAFTKNVEVNIVFEMKDAKLDRTALLVELKQAKQNRSAHVAVAVLAGTDIRASGGLPLGQWEDNCYFCVLDRDSYEPTALQLLYAQARLEALKAISYNNSDTSFFLKDMESVLEEALAAFALRSKIKTSLDNSMSSLKEAKQQFETLNDNVLEKLERLQKLLQRATQN